MKPRLNAPMGLLIDRQQPVEFKFAGQSYQGFAGDSIASALLANDRWLLSRSFKYHRPRGPLSLAGQDANSLVQLPDEANVLADRQPISQGLEVEGQNFSGSLDRDRDAVLGHFSRFMPVGFYYQAFFKPKGIWHWWENLIRKKAGLGKIDLNFKPQYHDKAYLFCDLAVVGAGPAGLQAALSAAQAGAKVLLIEEQPIVGGALAYHRFDIDGQRATKLRAQLLEQIQQEKNIQVMTDAVCNAWFADNYLPVLKGNRMYKVRAQQCILATGAFEQHAVFRNNDLPGVLLCSAASRAMHLYAVKPGDQAVVLTGNDEGYLNALDLHQQGVRVRALIDMRKKAESTELSNALSQAGIEILTEHCVYEAIPGPGNKSIVGVEARKITGPGEVADSGPRLQADLLCMSAGFMPAYQLACQAGGQLRYDDQRAAFSLINLPKHLHLAGSVNSVHDLDAVLADAKRAAQAALAGLKLIEPSEQQSPVICHRQVNYPWPIFPHPKGKDFVDFDEDLQVKDIVNATRMGYRDIQLVKRFSTLGMGPSQGRHSALSAARLVAQATQRSVSETGVSTARPPFTPEKLALVAGRILDPQRQTPMHDRHLQLGAQMMPAGNWQRPAYYGPSSERQRSVEREVRQVRSAVGLIDVSTLGGLELRGPDAAEFMNRMYTFGFAKQPVGRTRYAVLTNEQGVVVDDGVACRLADEHFYVSATTSGVERVYRSMTQWNAQWRLEVDITNVTSAFAAVNLAGPYSRQVLQKLVTDIDLSSAAFPYLAYREGRVADIPARLLRVGFVGELGYEIHVPSRYGEALWDALMQAGADFNIQPFGVEAQRLLRLEKGHIIVGQDTDGMSHPGQVSLDWAVSKKKPFFVGARSVKILAQQSLTRKLVGFTLENPDGQALRPKEGHLVLAGEDISGQVTSCEYSPTLNSTIGLAYVSPKQAEVGARIPIRAEGGALLSATVVELPFFDPNNLRQEL